MSDLLRKIHLTRSLNHMRVLFPHEYSFYPQTWFLPEQDQQFKDDVRYIHQQDRKHQRSLTTFIVKPSGVFYSIFNIENRKHFSIFQMDLKAKEFIFYVIHRI